MKGLILKDIKLIISNKTVFLFIPVLISMSAFSKNQLALYLFAYVAVMIISLLTATISYDDMENSTSFLMTMPVSRKEYAAGKYLLGIVSLILGIVIAVAVVAAVTFFKGEPVDFNGLMLIVFLLWSVMIVLMSVLIPLQLKFGSINGRVVLMCVVIGSMAVLAAVIVVLRNYSEEMLTFFVTDVIKNSAFVTAAGIIGSAVLLVLSFMISVRIMKKREL